MHKKFKKGGGVRSPKANLMPDGDVYSGAMRKWDDGVPEGASPMPYNKPENRDTFTTGWFGGRKKRRTTKTRKIKKINTKRKLCKKKKTKKRKLKK
jgi:hypothetical protein